uniref:5-taurinomethyluridine-[tRNA] synthase subunit GTPB3, mitochondrial n=1 Tax=Lepisosteus oculatus TaxID=7918 RepID=W5M5D7_LEPOC
MFFVSATKQLDTVSLSPSDRSRGGRYLSAMGDADTIFALSSGHGRCGVAVIRVSGPSSSSALCSLAGPNRRLPAPRTAVLRDLTDPRTRELLDRGLVLWFPGPHSFTGEDSAELHVHGGPAVISGVLQALGSLPGLRPAEAGEFTRRAFHAGKLDLTEVEGLGDLIHAETEAQRRQALRQMAGELGRLYQTWSQELVRCLAHTEAFIDFSEEEMIDGGVLNEVDECVARLESEKSNRNNSKIFQRKLRSGLLKLLFGAISFIMSPLLSVAPGQRPVAIVSPVPGTTRDIVETPLDIGGFPILLSDTAGLRDTPDSVEREGVRRARERVEQADLTLAVLDVTELPRDTRSSPSFLTGYLRDVLNAGQDPGSGLGRCLLVLNKTDLLTGEQVDGLRGVLSPRPEGLPPVCLLSCRTGDGLGDFLGVLQEQVETMCGNPLAGAPSLTQARHRSHLQQCCQGLAQYRWYRERDLALAAEGLRLALTSLGRITGRVGAEEILDVIFRDFCIGK